MLKNKKVVQLVCSVTAYAFAFSIMPHPAHTTGLAPVSFSDMYSMAQDGNVEGLRASVYRGLNIDYPNNNGDTGLCVAARRHDAYTYNTFRAAGANPNHPCVQNIPDYEEFVKNSRAVSVTEDSRTAYAALGKEEYKIAPWVWWAIGGTVVAGVVLALALSGGGGGGGHDSNDNSRSLGGLAAQKGTIKSIAYNSMKNDKDYTVVNDKTKDFATINLYKSVLTNTPYMDVILKAYNGGSYTNTSDTTLKAQSGVIAMDALHKSSILNNGYIKIESYNASVGMVASENSSATNNGSGIINRTGNNGIDLNFSGYTDTNTIIGMYADTKSNITNNGDIRGSAILASSDPLSVASSETSSQSDSSIIDQILDSSSSSSETQTTEETQTPTSSSATGTLIGMEVRLVAEDTTLNSYTMNAVNSSTGQISLSAGDGGTDTEIKVNLIGIGSFLDDGFLNSSYNITRAEDITLQNNGNITLGYTGYYTLAADNTLRKGTGGVIGIRADANTKAYNNGNIKITLDDYTSLENGIDVSAGMQSVHGGNLINGGNISVTASSPNKRINYGMVSVEGSGTVSGLYSPLNQTITNTQSGIINITASNSYGMASYNGGTFINSGIINLGTTTTTEYSRNIGIYGSGNTTRTTMQNTDTGTINVYSNHSIAMENDFSGDTVMENKGQINIYNDATDSFVFGGAYSEAYNYKNIDYYATSDIKTNDSTPGTEENPFSNYETSIGTSAMSTKGVDVNGDAFIDDETDTSSNTHKIGNQAGAEINLHGSSYVSAMSVENKLGTATNDGSITIEPNDLHSSTKAVGMYIYESALNNAGIINNGSITTNSRFSAAMASDSQNNAGVVNNGTIQTISNAGRIDAIEYSIGIYAANKSYVHNHGNIYMNNDNSAGIYLKSDTAIVLNYSEGLIQVGSSGNTVKNGYGILAAAESTAQITNAGLINVYTKNRGAGVSLLGESFFYNKNEINIYTDNTYAIYVGGAALVINEEGTGVINVGNASREVTKSYGIYISEGAGEADVRNDNIINVYSTDTGYGIYSDSNTAKVSNKGTINLNSEKSTALYGQGTITNENIIKVNKNESNGMATNGGSGASDLINNGTIYVGTTANSVSNSSGMTVLIDGSNTPTLTNNGTINLFNKAGSYAMSAYSAANLINNKDINVHSVSGTTENPAAIYLNHTDASFTNNQYGVINVGDNGATLGNTGGYGIKADVAKTLTNIGKINVYQSDAYGIYAYNADTITNNSGASINLYGKDDIAIYARTVKNISNEGRINQASSDAIRVKGIVYTGTDGNITNEGLISLVNGTAIEMTGSGTITNNGTINISGQGEGIHTEGAATVINNGTINISGAGSAAIYAYVPAKTTTLSITNSDSGQIYINETGSPTSYVIYIRKNYNLDVQESGGSSSGTSTKVPDSTTVDAGAYENSRRYAYYCPNGGTGCVTEDLEGHVIENGAGGVPDSSDSTEYDVYEGYTSDSHASTLFGFSSVRRLMAASPRITLTNNGLISVSGNINFGTPEDETETIIGAGGQYQADSFSGELGAGADITTQGFADEYELEDALVGADDGVKVYSKSTLFSAAKSINDSGNINITMTRRSFNETVSNPQMGTYLENNYALSRGESIFADLKTAETTQELDEKINNIFSFNFIPNLRKQAFDADKIVQREITEDILQPANDNFRHSSKILTYRNEVDGKNNIVGYKDKVIAGYTYNDMRLNTKIRAGLGLSAARVLSDYDDGASRYNSAVEVFMPITSAHNNITAVAKPKLGFGRGHYRRVADNNVYKDNTREYYYGADTQAKASYDLDVVTIESIVGFNLTGIYFRGIDESNGGLHTKADNIISAQSVIGTDVKKKFAFNARNALSIGAGGRYYHEFGDKSHTTASFGDLAGTYRINHGRYQRNTGLVNFMAEYEFNGFKFGASANMPIEHKNNTFYMLNFGYAM